MRLVTGEIGQAEQPTWEDLEKHTEVEIAVALGNILGTTNSTIANILQMPKVVGDVYMDNFLFMYKIHGWDGDTLEDLQLDLREAGQQLKQYIAKEDWRWLFPGDEYD